MSEQWTLPLGMREFKPEDYEHLARLHGSIFPDYERSPSEWRHWDESLDKSRYYFKRYTCVNLETGDILGFGQSQHIPDMFHPKKLWLDIFVDPQHQGEGVGSTIYQQLSQDLAAMEAVAAWVQVKEDLPASISFVAKRGFNERMRAWESRLNLSSVNLSEYQSYANKVSRRGIRLSTLAEEEKLDPECYEKLYNVVQAAAEDMPRMDRFTQPSYEDWLSFEIKSPGLIPDGYIIAKDGEHYVGVSAVLRSDKDPHGLYQGLTGVRREYRGRGIAMALKLRIIEFARRNGYRLIKTWNDSTNIGMLAINHKLGFKRQVGWVNFEKNLT